MAIQDDIEASDMLFVGDDKSLSFEIFTSDGVAGGTMTDASGFAMRCDIRKGADDADPPVVTKTTSSGITVTGAFNAVRATNTQRVIVAILDTDTEDLKAGDYEYTLKRTDAGLETTLAFGTMTFRKGTVR
jgi:hypothetical protein